KDAPGVVAVLTAADMDDLAPPPPDNGMTGTEGVPLPMFGHWAEPLLAVDRVRYVGEPVAIVIADDRYQGEDAAELVSVDYDPLPAVVGVEGGLSSDSLLFPAAGTNIAVSTGSPADSGAFDGCEVVVEHEIMNQRLAPVPLEGRAAAARWSDGKLTVWVSTQNAQISRFIMAGALGLDPASIRVIAPDVGGGFGAKIGVDRDVLTVAWAAKHIGRELRWAETRSENLLAMSQGRAQRHKIKIGGTRDGRILGYPLESVPGTRPVPRH